MVISLSNGIRLAACSRNLPSASLGHIIDVVVELVLVELDDVDTVTVLVEDADVLDVVVLDDVAVDVDVWLVRVLLVLVLVALLVDVSVDELRDETELDVLLVKVRVDRLVLVALVVDDHELEEVDVELAVLTDVRVAVLVVELVAVDAVVVLLRLWLDEVLELCVVDVCVDDDVVLLVHQSVAGIRS